MIKAFYYETRCDVTNANMNNCMLYCKPGEKTKLFNLLPSVTTSCTYCGLVFKDIKPQAECMK